MFSSEKDVLPALYLFLDTIFIHVEGVPEEEGLESNEEEGKNHD